MARSRRMLFLCLVGVTLACSAAEAQERDASPRMAGISTVYRRNSHAEMIIGRLVQGYHLNGRKPYPTLHLASLYTDQVPENDLSRELAGKHGFPVTDTVPEALTLGSDSLAIDGVLLVAEHGEYEKSATGNRKYPKRRLFSEIAGTFESTGEAVPVFIDKHLADNWKDAKWIYDKATELNAPLMAGSSLPVLWRYPPVDTRRDEQLEEIVALSFGSLDGYGFSQNV